MPALRFGKCLCFNSLGFNYYKDVTLTSLFFKQPPRRRDYG